MQTHVKGGLAVMRRDGNPVAAIVDYGMGNLFSVKNALHYVGVEAVITADSQAIVDADAVILPGVGAFGEAMDRLNRLQLVDVLREVAGSGKQLVGICLGLQLLMSESEEFGIHAGLDIIPGRVIGFNQHPERQDTMKVPQICWSEVFPAKAWTSTMIEGVSHPTYMYFANSFYVVPNNPEVALTKSNYYGIEYCSAVQHDNVTAFQFHPEKSGADGLRIYKNLATKLKGERL